MRTYVAFVLVASALGLHAQTKLVSPQQDVVKYVDPLIGSEKTARGYGRTLPLVEPPFAMTGWIPQTRQNKISQLSYEWHDAAITGFMGTHQPALWMGDFGYVTIIPQVGEKLRTGPEERGLPFTHADEQSHPDIYKVVMDAGDGQKLAGEMTATAHAGMMRFRFPAKGVARVLVEASRPGVKGWAAVDVARGEITGWNPHRMDAHLGPGSMPNAGAAALPNFKGYFVVQFRQKPLRGAVYGEPGKEYHGAYLEFAPGQMVEVRVGTSFISLDQARANLKSEMPLWEFDVLRRTLHAEWQHKLAKLQVTGASQDELVRLYTAYYRTQLFPRDMTEYGRYYSGFDDKVHTGTSYTAYSIWDTFRAEMPWLTLTAPERFDGMVTALLNDYKEGGWLPKWPNPSYTNIMIGTHADSILAEAVRTGFHGFDRKLAWEAAYKDATVPPDGDTHRRWLDREEKVPYEARGGLTYYLKLGYIPVDKTDEASSRTIEDSYDDWCVAQLAKAMGKEAEYKTLLQHSLNARHLYNPALHLMNGKKSDGSWAPISGKGMGDTRANRRDAGWTEGDAWVYTWGALHDQAGLMQLMGGADNYVKYLDEHFAGGHNDHNNEPSHHYGYLYDMAGQPWKTQLRVREIARAHYGIGPAGLIGDDDCGQMSAWLIFTAFGFYPVNPASGDFMIGSPLYKTMSLRLASGRMFRVVAMNNSEDNLYIQSATLNGRSLDKPVITWEDIQRGGTLRFVMGAKPSQWGSQWRPAAVDAEWK